MPQVGQDIPTAIIVEWKKQANDPVAQGEVIAVVESDKATFEVEAEHAGVLLEVLHGEGDEVAVFAPIATIGQPGESADRVSQTLADRNPNVAPATADSKDQAHAGQAKTPDGLVFASPRARVLAREHDIVLRELSGTGPGGRIIERDVLAFVQTTGPIVVPTSTDRVVPFSRMRQRIADRLTRSAQTIPHLYLSVDVLRELSGTGPGGRIIERDVLAFVQTTGPIVVPTSTDRVVPFSRMRQRIADRLTRSAQTIPHLYLSVDVEMTAAQSWRAVFNQQRDADVTVTDLIVKASAAALAQFPKFNAHVEPTTMTLKSQIHVGVATAVDDGLLVPVIPQANSKSLIALSSELKRAVRAAQEGSQSSGPPGTFTVTSLGMYGIERFLPIINPPECAILAVGAIQQRVVPIAEGTGVRDIMQLTLAADHRAVDGVDAARFLRAIQQLLENIEKTAKAW